MRTAFWLTLVIVVIFVIYMKFKLILSNIIITPHFGSINYSSLLSLQTLTLNTSQDIQTQVDINNKNSFAINFSDLIIYVYYKNVLIAQNVPQQSDKKIYLLPYTQTSFNSVVNLKINKAAIELFASMKTNDKENSTITYIVQVKIFGFPVKFSGMYNTLS